MCVKVKRDNMWKNVSFEAMIYHIHNIIWVALSVATSFPTAGVIDNRDFFANKFGHKFGKEIQITANVVSSLGFI